MAVARLKIYHAPEESSGGVQSSDHTVTAPVGEILPLLADAIQSERTWLKDFENDEVTISSDLYEVLLAYRFLRRPSA